MPMSRSDAGRRGALAVAERMTPEQRRARARKAHLASAVSAVVNRAPDLSVEQTEKLRAIFGGAAR